MNMSHEIFRTHYNLVLIKFNLTGHPIFHLECLLEKSFPTEGNGKKKKRERIYFINSRNGSREEIRGGTAE